MLDHTDEAAAIEEQKEQQKRPRTPIKTAGPMKRSSCSACFVSSKLLEYWRVAMSMFSLPISFRAY